MNDITLIRHGQANTGARDEASYDHLSDLGHQQARWLGEELHRIGHFELMVHGTMQRHHETLTGCAPQEFQTQPDSRFNEMEYFKLAAALHSDLGIAYPDSEASFASFINELILNWDSLAKRHNLECSDAFYTRVAEGLNAANASGEHVGVITSGGVIAAATIIALNTPLSERWRIYPMIAHTSLSRYDQTATGWRMVQFGAMPHLDQAKRRHAITYA